MCAFKYPKIKDVDITKYSKILQLDGFTNISYERLVIFIHILRDRYHMTNNTNESLNDYLFRRLDKMFDLFVLDQSKNCVCHTQFGTTYKCGCTIYCYTLNNCKCHRKQTYIMKPQYTNIIYLDDIKIDSTSFACINCKKNNITIHKCNGINIPLLCDLCLWSDLTDIKLITNHVDYISINNHFCQKLQMIIDYYKVL